MKKKLSVILTLIMLVTAAAGVCDSLFVDNRETDKIYPERLNLRTEPSKNGAILGLYYTGAEVENLGQENEEYTKVSIGGLTGYMATEYLITKEEAVSRYGEDSAFGECRAAEVDLTGMWMTNLPLYAAADEQSERLATIDNGASVSLVGVLDTWAYIAADVDGQRTHGYVPLDTLTDVGELKVSIVAGRSADTRTFLYDAPNSRAEELMTLKNGTACFSLFGRKEGEWRRVRVGGVSGWIKYTQTDNLYALADQPRSVVPYYPLLMQTKLDALLYSEAGDKAKPYMTLGKDMKVEVLAECGDYAYVRTLEGGVGAYDCGDFGYLRLSDLTLSEASESVGVAQADNADVPVLVMEMPESDATMLGALCPGAQVRIVEYTQTDYVQVALGDLRGYTLKNEIRILTQDGEQRSAKIPQRATTLEEISLKASPDANAKETETVAADTKVYMLGKFGDMAFVQASSSVGLDVSDATQDHTGFAALSALNAPASATHLTAFVNMDKVNLRNRASSTEGQIIGRARTGERLRVAEYGKNWSIVVTPDDLRGYIMTKYLDFE